MIILIYQLFRGVFVLQDLRGKILEPLLAKLPDELWTGITDAVFWRQRVSPEMAGQPLGNG